MKVLITAVLCVTLAGCHWILPLGKSSVAFDGGGDTLDAASNDRDGPPVDGDFGSDWGCAGPGCGAVAQAAPGARHTCILLEDGSVWCVGGGERGQLGDGDSKPSPNRVPVVFADPALQVAKIVSGTEHTCVLTTKGEVHCWGDDSGAQASGSNGAPDTSKPLKVEGLPQVTRLALGQRHSCALAGTYVWCWGDNSRGQQGQSTGTAYGPHLVPSLVGATDVTCGHNHCCALVADKVRCWGDNGHGQVGPAKLDPVATPTTNPLVSGVTRVRCGGDHCCAIHSDNTVACWGDNGVGQIGDSIHASYHPDPHLVPDLSWVKELALGKGHTCVLAKGKALCWGYNRNGQLGVGEIAQGHKATEVAGLSSLAGIAAGSHHTCAVGARGELWCWGDNIQGQVGNGEAARDPKPTPIPNLTPSALAVGGHHGCALENATISCWGYGLYEQLGDGTSHIAASPMKLNVPTPWGSVGSGGLHTCAVEQTVGRVWCWGANWQSQCGPSASDVVSAPALVDGALGGVVQVATAHDHTCARGAQGVYCWGSNDHGQLGIGIDGGRRATPQPVPVSAPVDLAARGATTCVVDGSNTALCWGQNNAGQLGNNSTADCSTPVKVQLAAKQAKGVAVGGYHACAVTTDNQVWCWGDNTSGQLGVPSTKVSSVSTTPVQAELPGGVVAAQVTAGWDHTCARTTTGGVYCWGDNGERQLGREGVEASSTPELVKGLPAVESVHGGWAYTCGVAKPVAGQPTAYCWGSWFHGQLGDGRRSLTWTPVRVN